MPPKDLKRILLIEDEPDIRTIASVALKNIGGFDIEACESGQEALELLQTFKPDLVILDVMMPGMDGPTTLHEIRKFETLQKLPVIFMTAKVQSQEVNEYMALGVSGVISKPFDPITLPQEIRDIWNSLKLV